MASSSGHCDDIVLELDEDDPHLVKMKIRMVVGLREIELEGHIFLTRDERRLLPDWKPDGAPFFTGNVFEKELWALCFMKYGLVIQSGHEESELYSVVYKTRDCSERDRVIARLLELYKVDT